VRDEGDELCPCLVERDELLDLRGAGRLRNQTLRQIERDLDLEEARIRS